MKKFILIFTFMFLLTGCEKAVNINVENNNNELTNNVLGFNSLTEIGNGLYYDSTTKIVYFWNGHRYSSNSTIPSPYYAPNGLPYKYNPKMNTFEEIKHINE